MSLDPHRDTCKSSIGHCQRIREYVEEDNTMQDNYFNLTFGAIVSTLDKLNLKPTPIAFNKKLL